MITQNESAGCADNGGCCQYKITCLRNSMSLFPIGVSPQLVEQ